jgi:hypothetical protein
MFRNFPGLPNDYKQTATPDAAAPYTALPPPPTSTPTPPAGKPPASLSARTTGTLVYAPTDERVQNLHDLFQNGDKSIQVLKTLPGLPKIKKGVGSLCLSYHLRGQCFDSCRRASTHRKLDKVESDNIQAFLAKHI